MLPPSGRPPLAPPQGLAMDDLPSMTTATFVGIMIAITGNVLISLALNLQKLAHKRVEQANAARGRQSPDQKNAASSARNANGETESRRAGNPSLDENDEDLAQEDTAQGRLIPESSPFTQDRAPAQRHYGSGNNAISQNSRSPHQKKRRTFVSRLVPLRFRPQRESTDSALDNTISEETSLLPVDIITEDSVENTQPPRRKKTGEVTPDVQGEGKESDYLKSKLWWLGFTLMNVGELGNFISYAWAPASVVAPLGTFALMANCAFAPLLLGERFRKRDLVGILIAIIGAVTVVLASNASDVRLNPEALIVAISQPAFIVYSCVYAVGAMVLATLSHGSFGKQWVFVDVGLCAIFGGFTVLSTKAISTLLTMEWIEMFTKWITYPTLAVLILTGIGQIRYLNRALMRFDSKVVIPIQFVLFTLSAIIGSAILYGDFKKAKFHQIVTFLYGCAATFTGVFIIAWSPNQPQEGSDQEILDENGSTVGNAMPPGPSDETRPNFGTLGRRRAVSLLGLSPAQPLLLVHTPPREVPGIRARDLERGPDPGRDIRTPDSYNRRRTMSWLGEDTRSGGTRDSSLTGRFRTPVSETGGRVGSLDGHIYRG